MFVSTDPESLLAIETPLKKSAPLLRFVQVPPARWWQPQRVRLLFGEIPCRCSAHWIWLFSLREHQSHLSALADSFLFREQLCPPHPPVFSSQGLVRKKQQGRGSQCTAESELTLSQSPHASLSPHKEVFPILFSPAYPAQSRLGGVTKSWMMTACH